MDVYVDGDGDIVHSHSAMERSLAERPEAFTSRAQLSVHSQGALKHSLERVIQSVHF